MRVLEISADGTKTTREMTAEEQEAFWREPEEAGETAISTDVQAALAEFAATLADPGTNSIDRIRQAAERLLAATGGVQAAG